MGGYCGVSADHCNAKSTWKAGGCSSISTCSGEPCDDASYCRSKWGYCGVSADHCNAQSTWKAGGCSGGAVLLDQPPSRMQVRRKGTAPRYGADPVPYDEPARVFLAPASALRCASDIYHAVTRFPRRLQEAWALAYRKHASIASSCWNA